MQAPSDFTLTDCADTPGVVTHGTKSEGATYTGRGVEVQGKTTDSGVGAGFNMFGGSISGNTLTRDGFTQGGGVYAGRDSVFRMYGGSITGNRLICTLNNPISALDSAEGGGVYVAGRLHISGAPVIAGNTAVKSQQSTTNNYYGSSIAYILGTLANGTQIGVSQDSISSLFAAGWDTGTKYTLTSEDAAKFIPDDSGYTVKLDGNYLYLTKSAYTVTFHENGGTLTGKSTMQTGADGKLAALPSDPTRSGYTFDGWYTAANGGDKVDITKVYTADTDLYAHWTHTGSSSGGGGSGSSSGSSTYPVTVTDKIENGSVTVSSKNASKGTTVTVTVTPDTGYTLETLTVTDKNGNKLTLKDKGSDKYTFTQPSGKVTVTATFMDDNTMLNYFVDVQASDYYYDAVLWAAQKGITSGTDAAHFSPNQPCTRAQIVTFLWRTVGSPVVNYAMSMDDVNEGSYYAEAVRWALSEGITGGVGDGRFDHNATCTREQAAAFLYRAAGSPAVSGGSAFSDVAANAYYADAVTWAEKNGVTGGIGGGLFGSGRDCTRAQIVTFLYRTYSK